jgi:hypothetical protein
MSIRPAPTAAVPAPLSPARLFPQGRASHWPLMPWQGNRISALAEQQHVSRPFV